MGRKTSILPVDYVDWLSILKQRIAGARQRIVLSANSEQIRLYHFIGREILERQIKDGWGAKVIERISMDLRDAFPDMKGFSSRNLHYMRLFAEQCPGLQFVQQSAAELNKKTVDQLPWFHIVILLTRLEVPALREWYACQSIGQGWSRELLETQIKNNLHLRQGAAITNFERRLDPAQSNLAKEILKDPYHFDFLGLDDEAHERDIENALIRHITRFLMELGAGFAFVARQYRLEVEGEEFFIDLLFYHTRLKCYVVVELKAAAFKPEHVGQLNFYLSAIDAQIKSPDDRPTIGLLLCKTKKRLVAEYALSGIEKPMGVAQYQLVRALPEPLDTCLPSIKELEEELSREWEVKRESKK
jgi:predicted nuclease of restriction endonuclease-like (RecB) superfamily